MHYDLEAIEFYEILNILKKYAKTNYAKEHIDALVPTNQFEEVLRLNQETKEAYQAIVKLSDLPLGGLFEIKGSLERCAIGSILDANELLNVVGLLDCSSAVYKYFKALENHKVEIPHLKKYSDALAFFPQLKSSITLAIDYDGNINDNASREGFISVRKEFVSVIADSVIMQKINKQI